MANLSDIIAAGGTPTLPALQLTGVTTDLNTALTGDDLVVTTDSRLSDARTPVAHNQAFSTITTTPTTLSGYGITDAVTTDTTQTITGVKTLTTPNIGVASGTSLTLSGTTDATSKDTGCLVVEGGIGVEKSVFAGGNITSNTWMTITGASAGLRLHNTGTNNLSVELFSDSAGQFKVYNHANGITSLTVSSSGELTVPFPVNAKGLKQQIRTVTDANATMVATDYTIRMSTGASNRTVNLSAAVAGQIVVIKKIDSGAGTVTFVSGTSCTIDGSTSRALSAQYESLTLQCVTAGASCVFDII